MPDQHAQATRTDAPTITAELVAGLGATLTAYIAGVSARNLPHKWVRGVEPRDEAKKRLTIAYRCWLELVESDGQDIARNWFIGANPRLSELTPAECIRVGKHAEVLGAVAAFIEDTGGA